MVLGNDPIDTDDALCADDIVQTQGLRLDLIAQRIGDTRRSDLVHLAFVFGIVVEELIMRYDLRNRESHRFFLGLIQAAGHFGTLHERLADDLVALLESPLDGRVDIFDRLHFGATERTAADIRFDETR